MAIKQEIWKKDIQELLLNDNNLFINRSVNHDADIVGRVVHIPQAGANGAISVDRSSFPATAALRTDTDLTYTVKSYSIDPVHVLNFDEVQLSYNKRMSVMGAQIKAINERMGLEAAFSWGISAVAGKIIRTTGTGGATQPSGTTGTRKKLTVDDFRKAVEVLDIDNVPSYGRVAVMQTNMYYELFGTDALLRKDFGYGNSLPTGVINTLFGVDIYVRPEVVGYDNTGAASNNGTIKAVGSAYGTTDSFGCIIYQEGCVAKAMSAPQVYFDNKNPLFYGDVISAEVFMGSTKMRTDNKGLVAIAQANV